MHVVAREHEAGGAAVDNAGEALQRHYTRTAEMQRHGVGVSGSGWRACTFGCENCSSSRASPRLLPNLSELTRTCSRGYTPGSGIQRKGCGGDGRGVTV